MSTTNHATAPPTAPLDPGEPAAEGFRRVLADLAMAIDANRAGAIEGNDDERLHDLRVAVRRTRSVLSQSKGVLPEEVRARHRDAFRELARATGPARDLDVYMAGWDGYVAPLGSRHEGAIARIKRELDDRRARAHVELASVLSSADTVALLDGWVRWLAEPVPVGDRPRKLGPVVAHRIHRAQRDVLRDGRAIGDDSAGRRLHDLRKDAKRLRYLLECFGSLFPPNELATFVDQLKDLQDNLGRHQDAVVHLAQLRDLAHDLGERSPVDTDALLAIGRLSEHLDGRRLEERRAFAKRFDRYDRKRNRKRLDRLLEGIGA